MTTPDITSGESLLDRLRRATLGRYDIYAELGSGGMATVFLARDLSLDRKVAIKVMAPALVTTPDSIERFRREARVAAALSHPHIIPIHAIGEEPGIAYYVMKYLEGRTLDSVLRDEGAQSPVFVRTVLTEIGNALLYAHQRGVVHRDIKPANIMLDIDGWLVVTDFGIAKRDDAAGLTQSGTIIGTPFYMSPEQFNGQPVTGAADQYALGIVAYELLAGRTPFGGPSLGEVMKGHLLDPVPPLSSLRQDVPGDLEATISRMLDKDPASRFPSLAEAVHAAGSVSKTDEREMRTQIMQLAKTGALAQPQMAVPASPAVQARPKAVPAAGSAPTRPIAATRPLAAAPSRRPWIIAALLLFLVGGGAGVAWQVQARAARAERAAQARTAARQVAPPLVAQPQAARPTAADAGSQDAPTVPSSGSESDAGGRTTPPSTPPSESREPANAGDEAVAAAESIGAAATKAMRDSLEKAGRTLRDRILNPNRRQQVENAQQDKPALATLGLVRIGSRTPRATIQVNQRAPRPLGRQVQGVALPAGPVHLTIRAPGCAPWDTTITVTAREQNPIGFRELRCR